MYWLSRLFKKEKTERQLDSELRFHLEQQAENYVRGGMDPEQARRRARIEFGGMESVKEECRESRRVHLLDTFLQDTRFGLRLMRKNPSFTVIAVLTLTLGIGANTAIFSVVNGVLLNPLPFPQPEQLVALHESKANFARGSISYPNFHDWQKDNHTFSAMAISRGYAFSLTGLGDAEQVQGEFISSDFFPLLGVSPLMGRQLAPGEDEIGATPVVLISQSLWQEKFAASRDVLGKAITLDGRRYSIIGVIPASFDLAMPGFRTSAVYVPIGQWNNPLLPQRSSGLGIHGVGRLKPGIPIEQAQADMDQLTRNLAAAYPVADKGIGATLVPLKNQIVGQIEPFLVVLLGAVAFVLLIACVNVANLLLARSNRQTREVAVRVALGANKSRLVRQFLTESTLLALAGGGLGLLLAAWGTQAMLKTLPTSLPRAGEVVLDGRVLGVTLVVSLLSGVLFGLIPALKTSRTDVAARINESGRTLSPARHRVQNAFVVIELGMALVLLTGAGLMIRSLTRLWNVDPGFDAHNVLTFSISLPPSMMKASAKEIRAAFREIDQKLSALPGITAESVSWGAVPMQGDDEVLFWKDGEPKPADLNGMSWALHYVVEPDYLRVMKIPLLRGRFFDAHDDERSPLALVVDDVFAEKFFPGENTIGRRIHLSNPDTTGEIVGVVKHVKQWGLDSDDKQSLRAQMYTPFMQLPGAAMELSASGTGIMVRSKAEAPGLFASIRSMFRQMNSEYVVFRPESMEQTIAGSLAARRFSMILLGAFAGLALLLASIGIYGVISYVVGQQTQEIGIRMALGARRSHVLGMVLGKGARLILAGVGAGMAAALALTHLMSSVLFGVTATDPPTFLSVAGLLVLVALLACLAPARRATRVHPMVALRCE